MRKDLLVAASKGNCCELITLLAVVIRVVLGLDVWTRDDRG